VVTINFKPARQKSRAGFTMIELVFVIVVLGILAAVAIPRLAATRDDAAMVKGRSDVSAIRSGIALQRSRMMLEGNNTFPANLDGIDANYGNSDQRLFNFSDGNASNILEYPIFSANRDGGWLKATATTYTYSVGGVATTFTYTNANGLFNCVAGAANCNALTR